MIVINAKYEVGQLLYGIDPNELMTEKKFSFVEVKVMEIRIRQNSVEYNIKGWGYDMTLDEKHLESWGFANSKENAIVVFIENRQREAAKATADYENLLTDINKKIDAGMKLRDKKSK